MKLIAILLLALAASAQDAPPTGGRPTHIITRTRTVAQFQGLEAQLSDAIKNHDTTAFSTLLADDFEARTSTSPSVPIDRATWLDQGVRNATSHAFAITDMAVHLYGDSTAVVSFNLSHSPITDFTVDVWTRTNDQWKLSVRYISPGQPAPVDRKPTGKQ